MPRWGKIGKQKIEDDGPLPPHPMDGIKYNMETVDGPIRDFAINFMDKAKADGKPFFVWINPTRMHVVTHLSPKYTALMNSDNGWCVEEAGMAQMDDDIGLIMQHLKDMGVDNNTIVVFTTDNGTENFTWPDGECRRRSPECKAHRTMEGGFRVPCIVRWPGHVPADSVQNGIFSGLDWFPTFLDAAGNPNITQQLLDGVTLEGQTYKNHLDWLYDQMAAITGQGPSSRHELFLLHRKHTGGGANRRLQISVYRPTQWLAWRNRKSGLADSHQSPAGSV